MLIDSDSDSGVMREVGTRWRACLSGSRRDPGTEGQLTRLLDTWSQKWRDEGQIVWPGKEGFPGEVWVSDTNGEDMWNRWRLWKINDAEGQRFQTYGSIEEDPRRLILQDCGIHWWHGTWKWTTEDVSRWMRDDADLAKTPLIIDRVAFRRETRDNLLETKRRENL